MARFTIEFDTADEMAAALEVLRGKAGASAPSRIVMVNRSGHTLKLHGEPAPDGGVEVYVYGKLPAESDGPGTAKARELADRASLVVA